MNLKVVKDGETENCFLPRKFRILLQQLLWATFKVFQRRGATTHGDPLFHQRCGWAFIVLVVVPVSFEVGKQHHNNNNNN